MAESTIGWVSNRRRLLSATAISLLLLTAGCADGVGFDVGTGGGQIGQTGTMEPGGPAGPTTPTGPATPTGPSGPTTPTGPGTTGMTGSSVGLSVGSTPILGASGADTLAGVNVLPGATSSTGTLATANVLTGDGTVANVMLPTTSAAVQAGLAPAGDLAGALLGQPVGAAVNHLTASLSPTVATVTSTVGTLVSPVLGTVNTLLSPVTDPLVAATGPLAPVTSSVQSLLGTVTGSLGTATGASAPTYTGPALAVDIGGKSLGASTAGTLVGANLLPAPAGSTPVAGTLVTADVLADGKVVGVALPTTTAGVQAGLAPVATLAGSVLGPQAGGGVGRVPQALSPPVAAITTVQTLTSPILATVNTLAAPVAAPLLSPTGPLAPVGPAVQTLAGTTLGAVATAGPGTPPSSLSGVTDTARSTVGNLLGATTGGAIPIGSNSPSGASQGIVATVSTTVATLLGPVSVSASSASPAHGLVGGLLGGLGR